MLMHQTFVCHWQHARLSDYYIVLVLYIPGFEIQPRINVDVLGNIIPVYAMSIVPCVLCKCGCMEVCIGNHLSVFFNTV